ncbi:MAG: alkaline phosphatase family protein [Sphingomonas sp.]|uniref:alkaline phosphatase family protein n=1 Tax=Sphingomonas sp. TaxID=28214 RepID=UPI001B12E642|nr:ectonucleotide pyrophosphatase/phosphodiesterase [Sphingomonas sp.]MBO9621305.1 alkaline phosphatase family protein [Sphingomonas sp.]
MRWYSKLAAAAAAALLQACATAPIQAPAPISTAVETRAPVTILVSIDGFRPDYLDRGVTPMLSRLAAEGATGRMRPSFPSKTFPNHWTLVTGLRPDRHGIVANKMEDPARPGEIFTQANDDPFWWNAATPIWVDAERAGIRTATEFWPGSNVAIGGTRPDPHESDVQGGERPSDWHQFNEAIDGAQRVDAVLDWLRRPPALRPRLVTLYFDTVDTAGHHFGPADARTTAAVAEVDRRAAQLVAGLAELDQPANLILVADHGMAPTSSDRVVTIEPYVAAGDYRSLETGPFATIIPAAGKEAAVEKGLLGRHPHMECWRRREIPARFHYGANPRIAPIFCLAETGWLIARNASDRPSTGGAHGYDPAASDMAALFIAHGPAFRAARLPAFDNVDVYPLLRDLLGLPPAPAADGSDTVFAAARRR